ncbi:hypothetical protein [Catellatospora sichuanensis]|uniref:hypothetical protein n=1 Tax=Catellatospora sichuanensis TaxID=1969805 RepID=UPI00118461F0|nr:hypothetical protein [Catellatospora sichuanensis]
MKRRLLGVVLALPLMAALALSGCAQQGGDDGIASVGNGTAAATPSAGPSLSQEEKGLKFAQCMRENGVDMPDPDPNGGPVRVRISGGPVDRDKFEKAQEACKQYSPFAEGGPANADPQMAENMRKFAQCMRDNGVPNFPDPDGGRVMIDKTIGDDPDFEAAQKLCQEKFMPGAVQKKAP